MPSMKFRETRFDVTGRVVASIIIIALLVVIGAFVAKMLRGDQLV